MVGSRQRNLPTAGPHVIAYRATLDVPTTTLTTVCRWLAAHRRVHDIRPKQRAATVHRQAMLVLRWLKDATTVRLLAADAGVSIATAYRYLHEALDVIAAQAPELDEVLNQALDEAWGVRLSRWDPDRDRPVHRDQPRIS